MNDIYIHLTNNAIQKNNKNYGNFESENQIDFSAFHVIITIFHYLYNLKGLLKEF